MPPEMKVNPAALRLLAAAMTAVPWTTPSATPVPPDALPVATDAVNNLNANARALIDFQKWAEAENQRLAESFTNAAAAYEQVDNQYRDRLNDPGRQAALDQIQLPEPTVQLPPLPEPPSTPTAPDGGGYSEVKKTHGDLSAGDHGASLATAQTDWTTAAKSVEVHSKFEFPTDWEGDAAHAAFTRLNSFSEWLNQLSSAWDRLAYDAAKVRASHVTAFNEHIPIYTRYVNLEASIGVGNSIDVDDIVAQMKELQRQSDEVREEYAGNATTDNVQIEDPPGSSRGGGGAVPAPPGGHGWRPVARVEPAVAVAVAASPPATRPRWPRRWGSRWDSRRASQAPPRGRVGLWQRVALGQRRITVRGRRPERHAGGMPGGGPSTGTPKLPTEPSLKPAAASGGGGGGSGAGGGGAGGGGPMSPAVGAKTVGPAPATAGAGTAGQGAAPTGAGMGAGMGGGMAPMHGAQGQGGGKEKRRNPALAPDEDLYAEERPWTEAVIGNRKRREVQDDKESK